MELRKLTIGQLLDERVQLTPLKECMGDNTGNISWQETGERVNKLAIVYLRAGIKKAEHVAIWGINSKEWIITYLALSKIGAISVLINTALKKKELEVLVKENDIQYIIYGNGQKGSLLPILQELQKDNIPCLKRIFSMAEKINDAENSKVNDFGILRNAEKILNCDDVISILFTSGTSGKAKGVMLTHYNLINNAAGIVERMHWKENDIMCIAVPLFHCFGVTVGILGAICSGASLKVIPYFGSVEVLETIEKYRCTVFNGVPTFYLAVINNEQFSRFDTSSLTSGLMAGSPIIPSEYAKIVDKLKIKHLQTAFGQTESSPAITISLWDDSIENKAESSGKLMEHVELRIWKREENCLAGTGEEGEIQTRGYLVMKGYYKKKSETAEAIDKDGWLHTGDWGYLDAHGYLHVTGRIKDIILRGGENIAPAEIENVIAQMPEVKAVKVIGIKVQILQEEVAACIIWKNNRRLSDEEVKEYVRNYLADFKVPKFIYTFQEFPVNSSGKVETEKLKAAIRKTTKEGGK